jgi:hypothetical protein
MGQGLTPPKQACALLCLEALATVQGNTEHWQPLSPNSLPLWLEKLAPLLPAHKARLERYHHNIAFVLFEQAASTPEALEQAFALIQQLAQAPQHVQGAIVPLRFGLCLEEPDARNPIAGVTERSLAQAWHVVIAPSVKAHLSLARYPFVPLEGDSPLLQQAQYLVLSLEAWLGGIELPPHFTEDTLDTAAFTHQQLGQPAQVLTSLNPSSLLAGQPAPIAGLPSLSAMEEQELALALHQEAQAGHQGLSPARQNSAEDGFSDLTSEEPYSNPAPTPAPTPEPPPVANEPPAELDPIFLTPPESALPPAAPPVAVVPMVEPLMSEPPVVEPAAPVLPPPAAWAVPTPAAQAPAMPAFSPMAPVAPIVPVAEAPVVPWPIRLWGEAPSLGAALRQLTQPSPSPSSSLDPLSSVQPSSGSVRSFYHWVEAGKAALYSKLKGSPASGSFHVALTGEKGLGKSTLLGLIRAQLEQALTPQLAQASPAAPPAEPSFLWLVAPAPTALPQGGNFPLQPWVALLWGLLQWPSQGLPLAQGRVQLGQFLQFLAGEGSALPKGLDATLAHLLGLSAPPPLLLDADALPFAQPEPTLALATAMAWVLGRLAAFKPTVLVLDNMDTWDEPALLLLEQVLQQTSTPALAKNPQLTLLLVHAPTWQPSAALRQALHPNTWALGPLAQEEVATFLNQGPLHGQAAHLPARLQQTLLHQSQGSCLVLEEWVRLLFQQEVLSLAFAPVEAGQPPQPPLLQINEAAMDEALLGLSLEEVLLRRFNALEPAPQQALCLAYVLGQQVPLSTFQSLLQLEDEAFQQVLSPLWQQGWLQAEGPQHLQFRHSMLYQLVGQLLPTQEQQRLHAWVLETLTQQQGEGTLLQPGLLWRHAQGSVAPGPSAITYNALALEAVAYWQALPWVSSFTPPATAEAQAAYTLAHHGWLALLQAWWLAEDPSKPSSSFLLALGRYLQHPAFTQLLLQQGKARHGAGPSVGPSVDPSAAYTQLFEGWTYFALQQGLLQGHYNAQQVQQALRHLSLAYQHNHAYVKALQVEAAAEQCLLSQLHANPTGGQQGLLALAPQHMALALSQVRHAVALGHQRMAQSTLAALLQSPTLQALQQQEDTDLALGKNPATWAAAQWWPLWLELQTQRLALLLEQGAFAPFEAEMKTLWPWFEIRQHHLPTEWKDRLNALLALSHSYQTQLPLAEALLKEQSKTLAPLVQSQAPLIPLQEDTLLAYLQALLHFASLQGLQPVLPSLGRLLKGGAKRLQQGLGVSPYGQLYGATLYQALSAAVPSPHVAAGALQSPLAAQWPLLQQHGLLQLQQTALWAAGFGETLAPSLLWQQWLAQASTSGYVLSLNAAQWALQRQQFAQAWRAAAADRVAQNTLAKTALQALYAKAEAAKTQRLGLWCLAHWREAKHLCQLKLAASLTEGVPEVNALWQQHQLGIEQQAQNLLKRFKHPLLLAWWQQAR